MTSKIPRSVAGYEPRPSTLYSPVLWNVGPATSAVVLRRARQVEAAVALAAAETVREEQPHAPYRRRRQRIPLVAIEIAIERRSGGGHRPLERRDRLDDVVERDRSGIARERFGEQCRVRRDSSANRATIAASFPFIPISIGCSLNIGTAICASSVRTRRVRPSIRRVVRHVGQRHGAARMQRRRSTRVRARGRR